MNLAEVFDSLLESDIPTPRLATLPGHTSGIHGGIDVTQLMKTSKTLASFLSGVLELAHPDRVNYSQERYILSQEDDFLPKYRDPTFFFPLDLRPSIIIFNTRYQARTHTQVFRHASSLE